MATKKPVKKTRNKTKTATKAYIDNIWAEVFWRAFESIKHTAPAYKPDQEALSLAIRAELAVVEAEKEKEASQNILNNKLFFTKEKIYRHNTLQDCEDDVFYSEDEKDEYVVRAKEYIRRKVKEQYTKYLIRSILLSLLVGGYTASFIINSL